MSSSMHQAGRGSLKNLNFILIPLTDGSVVKQLYPVQTVDGSNWFMQVKRKCSVEYIHRGRSRQTLTGTTANFHGGDSSACYGLLRDEIDFPFSTNHDSVSARPGRDMDVLQEALRKGLYDVFNNSPLEKFVTMNGLSLTEYAPPIVGDYDIEEVLKAAYAYC